MGPKLENVKLAAKKSSAQTISASVDRPKSDKEGGRLAEYRLTDEGGGLQQLALALAGELSRAGRGAEKTFAELASIWLEQVGARRVAPENERRHLGHLSALNNLKESALTPAAVQAALTAKAEALAPEYLNKLRSTGKLVIGHALESGLWRSQNPFAVVKRQKERRRSYVTLTAQEVADVLTALGSTMRPMALAAVLTGMRPGELVALRWGDVDFERGSIWVHRSRERSRTKTGRERRIPLHSLLEAEWRRVRNRDAKELLYPGKNGQVRKQSRRFSERFRDGLLKVGVRKHVRWYDLRHSAATIARTSGVDPLVIKLVLGHAARDMTDDIYTHLPEEYVRAEWEKIRLPEPRPVAPRQQNLDATGLNPVHDKSGECISESDTGAQAWEARALPAELPPRGLQEQAMDHLSTEFLTVNQVCELLQVARDTVYRWIEAGRLPAYRVADGERAPMRMKRDDVLALLKPVPTR